MQLPEINWKGNAGPLGRRGDWSVALPTPSAKAPSAAYKMLQCLQVAAESCLGCL
jgi:hypothetical protein